jgi:integrase
MACPQPLRDFATIMIETGLRPTEVRNLTVKDVFLENDGGLFVRKSKTKAGRRLIPYLSQRAIDILKPRMKNAENGFLFMGGRGFVDNAHYKALDRSGVPKFRIYDLGIHTPQDRLNAERTLQPCRNCLGIAKLK